MADGRDGRTLPNPAELEPQRVNPGTDPGVHAAQKRRLGTPGSVPRFAASQSQASAENTKNTLKSTGQDPRFPGVVCE
jgi:hypothetical protein